MCGGKNLHILFEFLDGPDEPDSHIEGPRMPHFRNSILESLQEQKEVQFNKLLESKVPIPAEIVRFFDRRCVHRGSQIQPCTLGIPTR